MVGWGWRLLFGSAGAQVTGGFHNEMENISAPISPVTSESNVVACQHSVVAPAPDG